MNQLIPDESESNKLGSNERYVLIYWWW